MEESGTRGAHDGDNDDHDDEDKDESQNDDQRTLGEQGLPLVLARVPLYVHLLHRLLDGIEVSLVIGDVGDVRRLRRGRQARRLRRSLRRAHHRLHLVDLLLLRLYWSQEGGRRGHTVK